MLDFMNNLYKESPLLCAVFVLVLMLGPYPLLVGLLYAIFYVGLILFGKTKPKRRFRKEGDKWWIP